MTPGCLQPSPSTISCKASGKSLTMKLSIMAHTLRRRGYGQSQEQAWLTTRRRIVDAMPGDWARFKELRKATGLGAATLTRHLKDMVAERFAERRVDTESGIHPPPTYYRLSRDLPESEEASITVEGLRKIRVGESGLLSSAYSDRNVPLDELTRSEVSALLRRVEDLLVELEYTLSLEDRRRKLGMFVSGVSGFEGVVGLGEYVGVFLSLVDRHLRSGVVGSLGEEAEVKLREAEFLRQYGVSPDGVELNAGVWASLNRALRDVPLTGAGFGVLCERRGGLRALLILRSWSVFFSVLGRGFV